MSDLIHYYPIKSIESITKFLQSYLPLVKFTLQQYKLNLNTSISGDHLGLQVLSSTEFDRCHDLLIKYCDLIHDDIIHNRRNRVYRFNTAIAINSIIMPRIEIFEPKPNVNISKLRAGIEHIAFIANDYDKLIVKCKEIGIPIDKEVGLDGSKFFKTRLLNGIEIEFRNDQLGESD